MSVIFQVKQKIKSDFGKDIIWTLLGQVSVMLVLLITNKVLSNILSVHDFGLFNIVKRSSSVLSFMLLGGLGISIPRYLAISLSQKNGYQTVGYIWAFFYYMFFIVSLSFILYLLLYNNLWDIILGVDSLSFYIVVFLYSFVVAISTSLYSFYRGIGRFKAFNLSQFFLQSLMLLPFLFSLQSVENIFLAWTLILGAASIAFVLYELINNIQYLKKYSPSITLIKSKLKEISIYSFPRLGGDIFLFIYSAFPVIYIGRVVDLETASFYSVGVSLVTMVTPLFSFLGLILLPRVTKQVAENKIEESRILVRKLAVIYIFISLPVTALLFFVQDWLICFFFADKYLPAAGCSKIICLSVLPQALYYLYRNPNDAASKIPFNTLIMFVCLCMLIIGFYFTKSLAGFAWVYLLVSFFQGLLSFLSWNIILKTKS